jgi:hypothetical protein
MLIPGGQTGRSWRSGGFPTDWLLVFAGLLLIAMGAFWGLRWRPKCGMFFFRAGFGRAGCGPQVFWGFFLLGPFHGSTSSGVI